MSASSDAPRSANRDSVVSANDGDVGADVDVVLGADAGERVGDVDGAEVAGALVHHVGRNRGEPFASERIGHRARIDLHDHCDDRHGVVLDGAHLQAIGQAMPGDARKRERRIRTDVRQPRAVRARHETDDRFGARQGELLLAARHDAEKDAPVEAKNAPGRLPDRLRPSHRGSAPGPCRRIPDRRACTL